MELKSILLNKIGSLVFKHLNSQHVR